MRETCDLAAHYSAQLLVMHVLQPIQPVYGLSPYLEFVAFDSEVYEKAAQENIRRDLCDIIKKRVAASIEARARSLFEYGAHCYMPLNCINLFA